MSLSFFDFFTYNTCILLFAILLTLSPPIPLRLYTLPYWSNPPFLIFDIRALYGAEPFEQQQLGTAGVKGVNVLQLVLNAMHVQFTYNEAVFAIHDIQYRPRQCYSYRGRMDHASLIPLPTSS